MRRVIIHFLMIICICACNSPTAENTRSSAAEGAGSNQLKEYIKRPKDAAKDLSNAGSARREELDEVAEELGD